MHDRGLAMHEVEPDALFGYSPETGLKAEAEALGAPVEDVTAGRLDSLLESLQYVTEALNALIVVNMRQYDALLSLIELQDPVEAQTLYNKHKEGGLFSPPIMIPAPEEDDPAAPSAQPDKDDTGDG